MSIISELMINEQIRDREIRLIGEDGEQLGIMSARDAMKLAREANLDLVKIAPTANHLYARLSTTASTDMSRRAERRKHARNRRPSK
mgnify:FL=1